MAASLMISTDSFDLKAFYCDSFMKIVKSVEACEMFRCTPHGPAIQRTASNLSTWMDDSVNEKQLTTFCVQLGNKIMKCLKYRGKKLQTDKIWKEFHELRTSDIFFEEWKDFLLCSIKETGSPFFYQYIANELLSEVIKLETSRKRKAPDDEVPAYETKLTIVEQNSLRYVCGYICRKVRDKCEGYNEPLKGELAHAIMQLAGDEVYKEGTEDWINRIDRGGLWHVNDDAYNLFVEFEHEAKKQFRITKDGINDVNLKQNLQDAILADDEVKFKWHLLSCEMSEQAASILFSEMLSFFITVRGFAFTSGCIEFYKQQRKKILQKKKALRKEIN